ncbi:MAG TPA: hypothetical protein VNH46_01310, partial [Gemmatimonadales bacterium]|nr:hypothetical protein [Gemmatimonadales bacterium]
GTSPESRGPLKEIGVTASPPATPDAPSPPSPRARIAARVLLHFGFLLLAIGCLALYEHLRVSASSPVAFGALAAAAGFGFAPVRDVVGLVFRIEGKVLHLVHALGGLGLLLLPLSGAVSGAPVLSHAAMAPFAIMGAAQAVMHQDHPRNARQALALRRFAASLPEVAQFTSSSDLTSPANAQRAVAALTDIMAKAEALGETELDADPGFQSALRQVTTRFGANLGLDAVELALRNLAANPATAGAVPSLRQQLAQARQTVAGVRHP